MNKNQKPFTVRKWTVKDRSSSLMHVMAYWLRSQGEYIRRYRMTKVFDMGAEEHEEYRIIYLLIKSLKCNYFNPPVST